LLQILYLCTVVLLQKDVFSVKDISDVWRGKVAEHIVGQELLSGNTRFSAKRNFWIRNAHGSDAEVDFIIQHDGRIIPVEVKSGTNSKIHSLHLYMDELEHQTAIRIWSGELSINKVTTLKGKPYTLYNVPFYYAGILETLLDKWEMN
jgi:predicted AAA+ superfamily ATPase